MTTIGAERILVRRKKPANMPHSSARAQWKYSSLSAHLTELSCQCKFRPLGQNTPAAQGVLAPPYVPLVLDSSMSHQRRGSASVVGVAQRPPSAYVLIEARLMQNGSCQPASWEIAALNMMHRTGQSAILLATNSRSGVTAPSSKLIPSRTVTTPRSAYPVMSGPCRTTRPSATAGCSTSASRPPLSRSDGRPR